jgi:hypothetical protein
LPQVHFTLLVTGVSRWHFFSYRRNYPSLMTAVERDENIAQRLADALGEFLERMDKEWARLCEMNGGPPRDWRIAPTRPAVQEPLPDNNDLPTP